MECRKALIQFDGFPLFRILKCCCSSRKKQKNKARLKSMSTWLGKVSDLFCQAPSQLEFILIEFNSADENSPDWWVASWSAHFLGVISDPSRNVRHCEAMGFVFDSCLSVALPICIVNYSSRDFFRSSRRPVDGDNCLLVLPLTASFWTITVIQMAIGLSNREEWVSMAITQLRGKGWKSKKGN